MSIIDRDNLGEF